MIISPAELAQHRADAESMMTLTLTPHVPTGGFEIVGGFEVPAFNDLPTHAGKAQSSSQAGADTATRYVRIGDVEYAVLAGGLHISLSAPVPVASERRGKAWEYTVDAVGPMDDPALLNRRYLVVGVPAKSFATARRLDVIEL